MNPGQPYNPFKLFTGIFIPEALVKSKTLSLGAKVVFGRLARYAGDNGKCYPRVDTLACEVGISERQAQRYIAELKEFGLISQERQGSTSSLYRFLWHPIFEMGEFPEEHVTPEVTDVSPPEVPYLSPKESHIEENHLKAAAAAAPPYLLTHEEWPLTTLAIQGRFQSVDSLFVMRLVQDSVQAAISSGLNPDELTDRRLCQIVNDSIHEDFARPGKTAGLLLKTVPQIIRTRAKAYQKEMQR